MKHKLITSLLIILLCFTSLSLNTTAADATTGFDASYYANKYPDVTAALGTDYYALYKHYVTFGIKEGRYQNQYEEDNKIVNSSNLDPNNLGSLVTKLPEYDTYVDVNIDLQMVTYFENGDVKFQSPCVSGRANGKRDTPKGTYKILNKTPGKRLKGPTWNCWVYRWMRFTNNAIGFHDATWRSEFGGEIYKTDGSHGCVNLPKEAAYELYDLIKVGTTVVVH